MVDEQQGNTAYGVLVRDIQDAEQDVHDIAQRVARHNKSMLYTDAALREDICALNDGIRELRADLALHKNRLLLLVREFQDAVHKEQLETLRKHADTLRFEEALLRSQIKDMIRKES